MAAMPPPVPGSTILVGGLGASIARYRASLHEVFDLASVLHIYLNNPSPEWRRVLQKKSEFVKGSRCVRWHYAQYVKHGIRVLRLGYPWSTYPPLMLHFYLFLSYAFYECLIPGSML